MRLGTGDHVKGAVRYAFLEYPIAEFLDERSLQAQHGHARLKGDQVSLFICVFFAQPFVKFLDIFCTAICRISWGIS